jgi:dipeptidyl aminopeptidase/acylaminoacyl peptidase
MAVPPMLPDGSRGAGAGATLPRMPRSVPRIALLLLIPVVASAAPPAAPPRPAKQYTAEQFLNTIVVGPPSFSADEKSVVFTSDDSGVPNVYVVPAGGGARPRALTRSKETTRAISAFPRDDRILFARDEGGNENEHLYVLDKGKEKDLTPGKLKATFVDWTRDLSGFYAVTNERDPKFFDLYRYDAQSYQRRLIYRNDQGYALAAVSPDEKWLVFRKPITTSDNDMYLYDVAAAKLQLISKHTAPTVYSPQAFDPESKRLYYTTDEGGEFLRLRRYEIATGNREDVAREDWDIDRFRLSWNGRYRLVLVAEDGRTQVKLAEAATGKPLALPPLPAGEIKDAAFSRSEAKIILRISSDRRPADLYLIDLPTQKVARLTDNLNQQIDPDDLVDAEIVHFKSFDGMTIPNVLWRPHRATPENRAPALVWVHGGPGGQTRAAYSGIIQFLVNHGYVVLGINNRGSSGYGRTFFTADDRKHGHEPLDDCVAAKGYLAQLAYVDPSKIAIVGGSYGGYMTLAALAFRPDEFALGVDLFGPANWVRVLKSIPPYWEAERLALYAEIGDPDKDEKMLNEVSPLLHADQIRKPLLVLQGKNDPRVLERESAEIVAAVKKKGIPVEYVVFPDEGHGFQKRKNEIAAAAKILEFLDRHLRGNASGAGPSRSP